MYDRIVKAYALEYHHGQIVYLKHDQDQKPRMVTGILLRPRGGVVYYLTCGDLETQHYGTEIDTNKDILKTL